jgi:hypothetical protein
MTTPRIFWGVKKEIGKKNQCMELFFLSFNAQNAFEKFLEGSEKNGGKKVSN